MEHLELKIFITALLLQELLDETVGETRFKYKMRRNINEMSKQLDGLLEVELEDDVSIVINKAITALEKTIEEEVV